jgi:hypothetical protein
LVHIVIKFTISLQMQLSLQSSEAGTSECPSSGSQCKGFTGTTRVVRSSNNFPLMGQRWAGRPRFDSRQGQAIPLFFPTEARPAVTPTQTPVHRARGAISQGVCVLHCHFIASSLSNIYGGVQQCTTKFNPEITLHSVKKLREINTKKGIFRYRLSTESITNFPYI